MAQFGKAVMTDGGAALLTKAQAGQCTIRFTRMAAGDGEYLDSEKTLTALQAMTDLKNQKQSFGLASMSIINPKSVLCTAHITNHNDDQTLDTGYYIREIGLYASEDGVPDSEVLYSLSVADVADFMPPYNGINPAMLIQKYYATVNNSANVTIHLNPSENMILVDDATGLSYRLGVENGQVYVEEIE